MSLVGPAAFIIRSSSREVMTSFCSGCKHTHHNCPTNRIESGSLTTIGAVFLCDNLVLLCVVNRSCLADFRADTTFSGLKFDTILGIDNRDIWNRLRKSGV